MSVAQQAVLDDFEPETVEGPEWSGRGFGDIPVPVIEISVSEEIVEWCKRHGRERNDSKHDHGQCPDDPEGHHQEGVLAEYAACWFYGVSMDTEIRSDGDDGVDYRVDGSTYDIKSCGFGWEQDLLVPEHCDYRENLPDMYVSASVCMDTGTVRLVGVIDSSDAVDREARDYPRNRPDGKSDNYVVDVDELDPVPLPESGPCPGFDPR
ncbi:hypothetical protein ACFQE1_01695 [Halobium palmae]|uniref:Uncharacterized protein n=1 Tax=Halobium palmae TaxID=1776492 RepID=A0ABD5RVX3_9EURY